MILRNCQPNPGTKPTCPTWVALKKRKKKCSKYFGPEGVLFFDYIIEIGMLNGCTCPENANLGRTSYRSATRLGSFKKSPINNSLTAAQAIIIHHPNRNTAGRRSNFQQTEDGFIIRCNHAGAPDQQRTARKISHKRSRFSSGCDHDCLHCRCSCIVIVFRNGGEHRRDARMVPPR